MTYNNIRFFFLNIDLLYLISPYYHIIGQTLQQSGIKNKNELYKYASNNRSGLSHMKTLRKRQLKWKKIGF